MKDEGWNDFPYFLEKSLKIDSNVNELVLTKETLNYHWEVQHWRGARHRQLLLLSCDDDTCHSHTTVDLTRNRTVRELNYCVRDQEEASISFKKLQTIYHSSFWLSWMKKHSTARVSCLCHYRTPGLSHPCLQRKQRYSPSPVLLSSVHWHGHLCTPSWSRFWKWSRLKLTQWGKKNKNKKSRIKGLILTQCIFLRCRSVGTNCFFYDCARIKYSWTAAPHSKQAEATGTSLLSSRITRNYFVLVSLNHFG